VVFYPDIYQRGAEKIEQHNNHDKPLLAQQ
jgi:hypothetical protein